MRNIRWANQNQVFRKAVLLSLFHETCFDIPVLTDVVFLQAKDSDDDEEVVHVDRDHFMDEFFEQVRLTLSKCQRTQPWAPVVLSGHCCHRVTDARGVIKRLKNFFREI